MHPLHKKLHKVKHHFITKIAIALILLSIAFYILIPSPDELFLHPAVGFLLSKVLVLSWSYGIFLSLIIYRGLGVVCFIAALLIGGKAIKKKIKAREKVR